LKIVKVEKVFKGGLEDFSEIFYGDFEMKKLG
jgi:hypothetical protein